MKFISHKKGYTVLESVVYVGIFAFLSIVIVEFLMSVSTALLVIKTEKNINNTAITVKDRLKKEIAFADSIDLVNTTTDNSSPGRLVLNSFDIYGATSTTDFYIEDGILKLKKDGELVGRLTSEHIVLENFSYFITSYSPTFPTYVIYVAMTLSDDRAKIPSSREFYTSIIMRGTY